MVDFPDLITHANLGDDWLTGLGCRESNFAIAHRLLSSILRVCVIKVV